MIDNLNYYFDYVLKLVKDAGKIVLEAKNITVETKEVQWMLVTEYDIKVEEILVQSIKSKFPDHKFINEEETSAKNEMPPLTDEPTWIIDPIDGTANFVRKFPFSCISVGFAINKELVIGIVFNPFLNELFTAIRGKGAYLNGKRIHTSKLEDITKSVINYELSLARNDEYREIYIRRFSRMMEVIQGIRSMGSAAIGLCYVANGATDAYQVDGLYPWDAAAGVVILREAGGYVCDTNGDEFDVMKPNFLGAATETLAKQYVALSKEADENKNCMENKVKII